MTDEPGSWINNPDGTLEPNMTDHAMAARHGAHAQQEQPAPAPAPEPEEKHEEEH